LSRGRYRVWNPVVVGGEPIEGIGMSAKSNGRSSCSSEGSGT
jgi:hypothetical protein